LVQLFVFCSGLIIGICSSHPTRNFLCLLRSISPFLFTIYRHPRLRICATLPLNLTSYSANKTPPLTSIQNEGPKTPG
jgi:hypothetical protein